MQNKLISRMIVFLIIINLSHFIPSNVSAVNESQSLQNSFAHISAGSASSFYIDKDFNLWGWGRNDFSQLGDGSNINRLSPVKLIKNVTYVSSGLYHSLAITKDGSLLSWGGNGFGQVGDGTRMDKQIPVKIMDNVVSVSTQDRHSFAIKDDGSLWSWGYNEFGQLGDGTVNVDKKSPVRILDNVSFVAAGSGHSLAVKKDGSLWAWGNNLHGQLGIESFNTSIPVKIMDDVLYVSAGNYHSMAIKKDKSLWVWGSNSLGQLGDNSTVSRKTPRKIMENIDSISAGPNSSYAIKTDSTLWAWGWNPVGVLGDGTTNQQNTPVLIMDNVKLVSPGAIHSLLIRNDGSLWTWGSNSHGQLGNEIIGSTCKPIQLSFENFCYVSITVASLPTKTSYLLGEVLDLSEAQIIVELCDGSLKDIPINSNMISDFDPYAPEYGPQTVTVSYGGHTTSFQVSLDRFSDVPYGHRNYNHINALVELGIINGYSDSTFRPNNTLTRAQAAIMIARAIGLSTEGVSSNFTDVPSTHAAYKFISAAQNAGIINGYSDGTFRPNASITRAQIAIMVQRAFQVQPSGTVMSFTDVPVGYAPKCFIETLASQKIVNGYSDGTFKPTNNVTRAQFSTMINNAIEYTQKQISE